MQSNTQALDTDMLYRNYAAAVTRWASRLVRSPADAEDIVQEVFLVVERRRASLPELHSPASWLFRITTNIVRRRWRDKYRHGVARSKWLDELPDETPGPLEDLERRRDMESLDRALGSLGTRDRQLLWLCDVRRLPTSRISALTGIKPQTLRVRRFRARRQMARLLSDGDQGTERRSPSRPAPAAARSSASRTAPTKPVLVRPRSG